MASTRVNMLNTVRMTVWLAIAVTVVAASGAAAATDSDAAEMDWLVATPNETAHVSRHPC